MKFKLFYGWYIVFAASLLVVFNSWLFAYGWTVFVNPILTTFGWSMTQLALASSMRGVETGLFNPIWGAAVDRYSARKLFLFGLFTTALGIIFLSQTRNLAMYYIGFLIMGVGSSLITGMLPTTVIARWFHKGIGKANGVYYTGTALGGVLVPVLVILVDRLGWQNTLFYSGLALIVLGIPMAIILRGWPADKGLLPDGVPHEEPGTGTKRAAKTQFGTSVKEALRTRAFWHLVVVTLFQNGYLQPLQTFTLPYLASVGMPRATAGIVISVYTTLSMLSRIPMGMLADRFKKTHVMAASVALQTAGLLVFMFFGASSPFWLILAFGICYGIGIAGIMPLRAPVMAEYFGTKNFGTIFGVSSIFITVAGVVSAPLAGWTWDTYQDFHPYWLAGIVMGVIALIAILTMPPPRKREEPAVVTPVK